MIRPRDSSAWHDYRLVFADLRSGRLSSAEYDIMCEEDATEANRRQQQRDVVVALADLPNALAQDDEDVKADMVTYRTKPANPVIRPKRTPLPPAPRLKVSLTFDPDDEYTHAIDLVDDEAVILIRNEPSKAI